MDLAPTIQGLHLSAKDKPILNGETRIGTIERPLIDVQRNPRTSASLAHDGRVVKRLSNVGQLAAEAV